MCMSTKVKDKKVLFRVVLSIHVPDVNAVFAQRRVLIHVTKKIVQQQT